MKKILNYLFICISMMTMISCGKSSSENNKEQDEATANNVPIERTFFGVELGSNFDAAIRTLENQGYNLRKQDAGLWDRWISFNPTNRSEHNITFDEMYQATKNGEHTLNIGNVNGKVAFVQICMDVANNKAVEEALLEKYPSMDQYEVVGQYGVGKGLKYNDGVTTLYWKECNANYLDNALVDFVKERKNNADNKKHQDAKEDASSIL